MALPEVGSVSLDPQAGAASVRYAVSGDKLRDFVARLAAAVGGGAELDEARLPRSWPEGRGATLHRYGDEVSLFEVVSGSRGRLQLHHPAIGGDPAFGLRLEESLRGLPGVREAVATRSTGKLWVVYDPRALGVAEILRAAEAPLTRSTALVPVAQTEPVGLGLANTTVGLATVGELVLPLVTPLCAGILVVTNFGMMRDAAQQVRRGKFGTPVWTTALLACSIVSGQVLAYALTDWSFRYWRRRWHQDVAVQGRALAGEAVPVPSHIRCESAEGVEVLTPTAQLKPGQVVSAATGEVVAVDGRVVSGAALVHETPLSGAPATLRKLPGDRVFAGSTVVNGKLDIEVVKVGDTTRAAHIAQAMAQTVAALPRDPVLERRSLALVDRTVPPTLVAAGVGLAMGNLFITGAVLHQDWLSGAELAVPLETFRDIRHAAGRGAIVRNPSALQRFAESKFVVLDDQPALRLRGLALGTVRSRLPDTDALLQHVAGAGLYLGDERAEALALACQERKLVVRRPELLMLDGEAVVVRDGKHRIVLRGAPPLDGETAYLDVEVDGVEVAAFEFRRAPWMRGAEAVRRLRAMGVQVFLVSDRPEAETAALARELGVELYSGELSLERKIHFLEGLRRRGVRPVLVGNPLTGPALREHAYATVSLGGGAALVTDPADIVLLGESLDPLADIAALSAENRERIVKTCRTAMVPNLLCVVGAFAGLLNGITAGILANIAVYNVYRAATASLRSVPGRYGSADKAAIH